MTHTMSTRSKGSPMLYLPVSKNENMAIFLPSHFTGTVDTGILKLNSVDSTVNSTVNSTEEFILEYRDGILLNRGLLNDIRKYIGKQSKEFKDRLEKSTVDPRRNDGIISLEWK